MRLAGIDQVPSSGCPALSKRPVAALPELGIVSEDDFAWPWPDFDLGREKRLPHHDVLDPQCVSPPRDGREMHALFGEDASLAFPCRKGIARREDGDRYGKPPRSIPPFDVDSRALSRRQRVEVQGGLAGNGSRQRHALFSQRTVVHPADKERLLDRALFEPSDSIGPRRQRACRGTTEQPWSEADFEGVAITTAPGHSHANKAREVEIDADHLHRADRRLHRASDALVRCSHGYRSAGSAEVNVVAKVGSATPIKIGCQAILDAGEGHAASRQRIADVVNDSHPEHAGSRDGHVHLRDVSSRDLHGNWRTEVVVSLPRSACALCADADECLVRVDLEIASQDRRCERQMESTDGPVCQLGLCWIGDDVQCVASLCSKAIQHFAVDIHGEANAEPGRQGQSEGFAMRAILGSPEEHLAFLDPARREH